MNCLLNIQKEKTSVALIFRHASPKNPESFSGAINKYFITISDGLVLIVVSAKLARFSAISINVVR